MTPVKLTAKAEILRVSPPEQESGWLTIHDIAMAINVDFERYSERTIATRANDLEHEGLLVGRYRAGESYREYAKAVTPRTPRNGDRRAKTERLHARVVGVQPLIGSDHELALVEVPKGRFLPQQEVSIS